VIDRLIVSVCDKIVPATQKIRIFGYPSPCQRVVVSRAKPSEANVEVVKSRRESERLKALVGISKNLTPLAHIDALGRNAGIDIDHESWCPKVTGDNPVEYAALNHVCRGIERMPLLVYTPNYFAEEVLVLEPKPRQHGLDAGFLAASPIRPNKPRHDIPGTIQLRNDA
jgi:hypothetical protein